MGRHKNINIPPVELIKFQRKISNSFMIKIRGHSMLPQLMDGDIAIISFEQEYKLGNIVLFEYKKEGQLLHRIVKIKNGFYYCKGDNAFRIERILPEQILGKAVAIKRGDKIIYLDYDSLIYLRIICLLSICVNKFFIKHNYNVQRCKTSFYYKLLQNLLKSRVVFK